MNIKEFLKPDKRKIIVLITIHLLGGVPVTSFGFAIFLPFMFIGTFFVFVVPGGVLFCLALMINIIFWYLITCFTFYIEDKYFKKQPKVLGIILILVVLLICGGIAYRSFLRMRDPSRCDNLSHQTAKNTCYYEVARARKDPLICNKITNEGQRKSCHKEF